MKYFFLLVLMTPSLHAEQALPPREKPFTLQQCVDIGLQSYIPLKLAGEEVELARLKRQEAARGLYPALSFKIEETRGEASNPNASPNFTEKNYGASVSHSLFEGGKIMATYKQAEASYQAALLSQEKTMQDFLYAVREAYWNLAAAQRVTDERETARLKIKEELQRVTEQYVLDLAVKQQFLAVKGQYLQANTQANVAKKNKSKAKWELAKALGLSKPVDQPVSPDIPFKKINVELDHCLMIAASHRPDIRMQEELVKIARAGRAVAGSAQWPKLNLNSFYGRSSSAFEGDSHHYREDWQVNANLSQKFFGNSVGLTQSNINTSPKLGQSSRTHTETKGANLNILDGMRERTDLKQADLAYRQAQLKKDDLHKEIAIDVENAFYNVNQAELQVEFSEEDEKLAEEESTIAQSKGRYGLSGVLELAQAMNRLSASRSSRVDSLAAYQVAVAALNRAIGVPDEFTGE